MAQDAIRRAQVEMEIGNGKLGDIALAGKLEGSHLGLHENLCVFSPLKPFWIGLFEQLDGVCYAGRELVKGLFVVLKDDILCTADAGGQEFGCVAAALDLEIESGCVSVKLISVISVMKRWAKETAATRRDGPDPKFRVYAHPD